MQTYSFICPSCGKSAQIEEYECNECGTKIDAEDCEELVDLDCIILSNFEWITNIDRSKARKERTDVENRTGDTILIGRPYSEEGMFSVQQLEADYNMVGLYRKVPDNKNDGAEHGPFE